MRFGAAVRLCIQWLVLGAVLGAGTADAQVPITDRWIAIGNLHGWFSSMGNEIEVGRAGNPSQQDGLQWPGLYLYQDVQAAKGLWIGTRNFNDGSNPTWAYKVVHVGPRPQGVGEFFPMRFDMISRLQPPVNTVDGNVTVGKPAGTMTVDPALPSDRMIINEVNTAIGLSLTRKVLAWGQQFHDNYFIYELTFRNTGNADDDPTIEFPGKTLDSVYIYYQHRWSATKDARYIIGNQTGWGINTMNDVRGDGLNPTSTFFPGNRDNDVRASYAWHGRYPPFTGYDNIGGPVWTPNSSRSLFSDPQDTSGRLCAPQFVGVATIHADSSATVKVDAFTQPSTTSYEGSDDILQYNNSQFSPNMEAEYNWMRRGHVSPRHADLVGPSGDPSIGRDGAATSGGQSSAIGYGPYTLRPGDSIKIVFAEAVAGLSREKAVSVGRRYKNGARYNLPFPQGINAAQKNDSVYSGRDSLFQTFRRAIANYRSGYAIPNPPFPPRNLAVTSGIDGVNLSWDQYSGGAAVSGWRVYRALGEYWRPDTLIAEVPASARSYKDTSVTRGVAAFYSVLAVGNPADNNGAGGTPAGVPLTSSRYYAQTYEQAVLKRPAPDQDPSLGIDWRTAWRIVPNPYHVNAYYKSTDAASLRFPGQPDKIAFFEIPGYCWIRIYTELGELVTEIDHDDGTGDASWNSLTKYNQVVVSGVYIVVLEDKTTGDREMQKLVIIR
jgi:hypothetical protein